MGAEGARGDAGVKRRANCFDLCRPSSLPDRFLGGLSLDFLSLCLSLSSSL